MDDFDEFVRVAWPGLLRSAWLLTGDWHRAEDLVQTVLARAYGRWSRIRNDAPQAYLRRMMATTYLNWWRRKWRGEMAFEVVPEQPANDPYGSLDLRVTLAKVLASLPRQQRAVLMLRFHADLTEAQTANAMGISLGTVKSYTARALATLRDSRALQTIVAETRSATREASI